MEVNFSLAVGTYGENRYPIVDIKMDLPLSDIPQKGDFVHIDVGYKSDGSARSYANYEVIRIDRVYDHGVLLKINITLHQ